jgi:hypothetical protein
MPQMKETILLCVAWSTFEFAPCQESVLSAALLRSTTKAEVRLPIDAELDHLVSS